MGTIVLRIAHLEISNFRGIKHLEWCPMPGMNCLVGPGDTCKTTILDAIELVLNPRYASMGTDADLFDGLISNRPVIVATLVDLPEHFHSDKKYGLNLRGWSEETNAIHDEREDDDRYALSVKAELNPESLEWQWSIENDRIDPDDPPRIRLQDAREISPNRLGAYADRDLTWGRYSALSKLEPGASVSSLLAEAIRSARTSFSDGDISAFNNTIEQAQKIGEHFSVPMRSKYKPQLDVQASLIASGAISLHDGNLPLRTLGTGSSRLLVAGLQHHSGKSPISLIDEIEHGLEPHRIMRLLRYLRNPEVNRSVRNERQNSDEALSDNSEPFSTGGQTFVTTHSPVVVRELTVDELHSVRAKKSGITVTSISSAASKSGDAQRHVRATPEAFLAPRILVGEGRTECGFLRGLDDGWIGAGRTSFAFNGAVAVDGTGKDSTLKLAIHLLSLGYECLIVLDTDQPVRQSEKQQAEELGGTILEWEGGCSIEQRIFLDVPWDTVQLLVNYAAEVCGEQRILSNLRTVCPEQGAQFVSGRLGQLLDTVANRLALGQAAGLKDHSWFKDMTRGERVGSIVFDCLESIQSSPLSRTINRVREWVDAGT